MNEAHRCIMRRFHVLILCVLPILAGCAAQTGIPGHGGGKRFAVEQELVAAATRTAVKQIDLAAIRGKKVNLYINSMGDTGSGNLTGGRFSIVSQLHGDYIQNPKTQQTYIYPRYDSTSSTTSWGRASGRSTLLMQTTTSRFSSRALERTKRVWGMGPSKASTTKITPFTIFRTRSTSPPKSE